MLISDPAITSLKATVEQASQTVFAAFISAVALVVSGYTVAIVRRLLAVLGIRQSAATDQLERDYAKHAVLYVEEWAANLAIEKARPAAKVMFEKARALLLDKAPWLTDTKVQELIHSVLAELDLGAAADRLSNRIADEAEQISSRSDSAAK